MKFVPVDIAFSNVMNSLLTLILSSFMDDNAVLSPNRTVLVPKVQTVIYSFHV